MIYRVEMISDLAKYLLPSLSISVTKKSILPTVAMKSNVILPPANSNLKDLFIPQANDKCVIARPDPNATYLSDNKLKSQIKRLVQVIRCSRQTNNHHLRNQPI
jgi:hypothetical protein